MRRAHSFNPLKLSKVDYAKVDLGPMHNGRVSWRNIFARPDGTRFIVDHGKHVTVLRMRNDSGRPSVGGIHYVTAPRQLGFN